MALINCPECGKRMSTLENSCPQCGHRTGPPAPAGPAAAVLVRPADPVAFDTDGWITSWARRCGGLLIFGFLFPLYLSGFGDKQVLWPWTLMSGMKGGAILGMMLPLLLGLAALAVGRLMTGVRQAIVLSAMAGGTWILSTTLAGTPGWDMGTFSARSVGAVVVLILMPLSACAVAIGNRIRKGRPTLRLARTLAGAGGIALVCCFLIPVEGRSPIIAGFFDRSAWRFAGPMMVVFVALLGYGVLGTLSLKRVRDLPSFCRLLSVVARAILWGAPLTLLFTFGLLTDGWGLGMAACFAIKIFSQLYGQLLLLAVGVASWIEVSIASRPAATASSGTRVRPASPPGGRATT